MITATDTTPAPKASAAPWRPFRHAGPRGHITKINIHAEYALIQAFRSGAGYQNGCGDTALLKKR